MVMVKEEEMVLKPQRTPSLKDYPSSPVNLFLSTSWNFQSKEGNQETEGEWGAGLVG